MASEQSSISTAVTGLAWLDGPFLDVPAPPLPDGISVATLAWRASAPAIDSVLPEGLPVILARALVSLGTVVFIDHFLGMGNGRRSWQKTPGGLLVSLPNPSPWWRLWDRRRPLDVMATESEAILATLGLAEGGWTFQQQAMFVVADAKIVDRLDGSHFEGCLGDAATPDLAGIFAAGVSLVMSPGHDGDWGTIHARPEERDRFRSALRAACAEAGLNWVEGDKATVTGFMGHGPWPAEAPAHTD